MKKNFVKLLVLIVSLIISTSEFTYGQYPGCPNISIDQGDQITTSCTNPCVTLSTTVLETGSTNQYSVSSIPYNPPFSYSGGTPVSVNTDDVWSNAITLPFDFCFFGNSYNQVWVGSNGVLTFSNPNSTFCPWSFSASVPSSSLITNAIFGVYHDIDPSVCGNVYYEVTGSYPCRTFVFKFYNVCYYYCNSLRATHQIVLYEGTNVIEVYVEQTPVCSGWNGGRNLIGIQNSSGSAGYTPPNRNTGAWSAYNEAWRFTPTGTPNYEINWYEGDNVSGTFLGTGPSIQVCPTSTTVYTAEVIYHNCSGGDIVVTDQITVEPDYSVYAGPDDEVCGTTYQLQAVDAGTNSHWESVAGATFSDPNSPNSTVTVNSYGTYAFVWTADVGNGSCSDTVLIKFNETPTSDFTATQVNCYGESSTITYTGNASGADYYWDVDGGTPAPATSAVGPFNVTWNNPGTHVISLYVDWNGCISDTSYETIIVPPELTNDVTVQEVSCQNYVVNTNPQGGTPPYTFTWSNGTGTNFTAGTYTVTVTDANGCYVVDTFVIDADDPISITINHTDVICYGGNDGSINVSVAGGTPPYTFSWSNDPTLNDSIQNNLTAGTYTVTITDSLGCEESHSITINQPTQLQANLIIDQNISCNGLCDGEASVIATQGTPPYIYTWSNGSTSDTAAGLCAGTISVTVTDNNGCSTSVSNAIIEPDELVATITSHSDVLCYGQDNGSAQVNITGGTQPYNINWSNGESGNVAQQLTAGTFTVSVVDANGCFASDTVTINEPQQLIAYFSDVQDAGCWGTCDGQATINADGGTQPYTYYWWAGTGGNNQVQNSLCVGNHTVTITDNNGCQTTATVTINQLPQIILNTTYVQEPSCYGYCDGIISINAEGGLAPYYYEWSTGENTATATQICADTIRLVVTDGHNCSAYFDTIMGQPEQLVASVTPPQLACKESNVDLSVSATGGTYPYSYLWETGDSTYIITVVPTDSSEYTVTVTDDHGCTAEATAEIYVYPDIEFVVGTNKDSVCPGDPVIVYYTATGGNPPYQAYFEGDPIGNNDTIYPNQAETYFLEVTDQCNYVATAEIPVALYPVPLIAFSSDTLSGCAPLTVNFNPNGDLSHIQMFLWNFGDNSDNNFSYGQNPRHTYNDGGTFSVGLEYTTDKGCKSSYYFPNMITVYPKPEARFNLSRTTASVINPVIEFYNLSSTTYASYWDFGDGTMTLETNPRHAFPSNIGNVEYIVTLIVETEYGCKDTANAKVYIREQYSFYAPTAFTPDGDENNPAFYVVGHGIDPERFYLAVFDRWGELIWATDKYDPENPSKYSWDGTVQEGTLAKADVYTWYCVYYDMDGIKHEKSGNVTLIR